MKGSDRRSPDLQPTSEKPGLSLRAVFLDLGNTLLRERVSRAELYATEARAAGLDASTEDMAGCMARAHASLPRELAGAFRYSDAWFLAFQRRVFVDELGLDPRHLPALSARLFARFEDPGTFLLYPGARELLVALRGGGLRIGLISNWSQRLPHLLDALELTPFFDFVLGSAVERMEKPEPAIFQAALAHVRFPADRCLHAGDDVERDARGALRAGIRAVLVDHAGHVDSVAALPCPVVSSLAQLQELILGTRS